MEKAQQTWIPKIKPFLARIAFVLLSAIILVFFSEKLFWYTQGFEILELTLVYALPAFRLFWVLDTYPINIHRFHLLVIVGALFAYLVEGIVTPVLYEDGLFGLVMPAYFVGWHGLLSVAFGWYLLRKWLIQNKWRQLTLASSLVGVFWGMWSLTYWLPENIADPALLALGHQVGAWSVDRYIGFTFWATTLLALAHWSIGYVWPDAFKASRLEKWAVVIVMGVFYFGATVPAAPIALIKLPLLMGLIFLALRASRTQSVPGPVFPTLRGTAPIVRVLPLFAMPVCASLVYGISYAVQLPEQVIRDIFFHSVFALQALLGGLVFLWSVTKCLVRW